MLDRMSQNPDSSNPEPERILRSRTPPITMVEKLFTAKPMKYFTPSTYTTTSCIRIPNMNANHYEIKSSVIQLLLSFYGLNNEDPYKHLNEFLEVSSTVKIQFFFSDDELRLTLFPFSLKDKAKHWFGTLNVTIQTWDQMQKEFLKKYYPIGRTNQMRWDISFSQNFGELFHETWERLRDLLRKCPHHVVSNPPCRVQMTIGVMFLC